MGYSFLYPSVLPRPHVHTLALTPQDEFFVLGSRGLWDAVSPAEAVEAVRNVPDALAAAKKLCTLAQGYGCTDSLSAVVVRLSVSEDCCCCCCAAVLPAPGGTHAGTAHHHHHHHPQPPPSPSLYPPGVGVVGGGASAGHAMAQPCSGSELSSEVSTSEMSSEVGSTASSDEPPLPLPLLPDAHLLPPHLQPPLHLPGHGHGGGVGGGGGGGGGPARGGAELLAARGCCALHPVCLPAAFQRQLSSTTFCSATALSDNALDSEDEEPIAGVFSNGSRVEVEADVHCRGHASPTDSASASPLAAAAAAAAANADANANATANASPASGDDPSAPEEPAGAAPACTPANAHAGASETPGTQPVAKETVLTDTTTASASTAPPPSIPEPLEEASKIMAEGEAENGTERERESSQAKTGTMATAMPAAAAATEREKGGGGGGGGGLAVAGGGGGGGGGAEQVRTLGRRRGNGSVAPQERSHNLIEVATEAPCRKPGGYFTAPAQPDPDDQFIIPPELEEEVKEIMKQHQQEQQRPAASEQPSDYYDTPL